jgi:hypothetical protein
MFNTELRDNHEFLWNPPRAMVWKTAGQSIVSDTWTLMTWDTEWFDTDGIWSSGASSRLTAITTGVYEITIHVEWEVVNHASPGNRAVTIQKSNAGGTTIKQNSEIGYDAQMVKVSDASGAPQTNHLTFHHPLTAGQYIEALCWQSKSLNVVTVESSGLAPRTYFSMIWMGTT